LLFRNLETERLFLKNIGCEDRDFIFKHFSDNEVNKYLFDAEPVTDISEADEIISVYLKPEPRNQHRWIIIDKINNIKMGTCGLHKWNKNKAEMDIGYDLGLEFCKKGYMQEALIEVLTFSKNEMGINYINACIFVENIDSIKLIQKLDFKINGTYNEIFRGKEYLHNIYTLHMNNNI
jgi:ribosomal-protein-alanine N-acetyltransferase